MLALSDLASHRTGHAVIGFVALALLAVLLWRWRPTVSSRAAKVAYVLLAVGLGAVVLGQLLEIVGASGYDRDLRVSDLATVHDIGVPFTPVGMVLAFVGAIGAAGTALLSHAGPSSRRWIVAGMVLGGVGIVLFVAGGFIFGY